MILSLTENCVMCIVRAAYHKDGSSGVPRGSGGLGEERYEIRHMM